MRIKLRGIAPAVLALADTFAQEGRDLLRILGDLQQHVRAAVIDAVRELNAARLSKTGDDEISDDPVLATYHLATLAPIGPADLATPPLVFVSAPR